MKDGCTIAHFSVGENAMYVFAKLKGLMETKENVYMMYQRFHFERVWLLFRDFVCYIKLFKIPFMQCAYVGCL